MLVQFLKDTSTLKTPESWEGKTLLIYKDGFGYKLPELPGVTYIEFSDFKVRYMDLPCDHMILIGINRIITPSNRCDFINEYLQTMTKSVSKISVDTEPFIGEPWRLWYHYSIANCGKFNVTYSFALETEWQRWFYYDDSISRLSGENIKLLIENTISDLDCLNPNFKLKGVDSKEYLWYTETKNIMFEKYHSPKQLINALLGACNKRYSINLDMNSYREVDMLEVPDFGVYKFVISENIRRKNIYNAVIS